MIKIVDYGLGNVHAFLNMYKRMNIGAEAAGTAKELEGAEKVILPGVGAFDCAMELLTESGMTGILERLVCEAEVPLLGVCVGMQMLARSSEEGLRDGLGWVPGKVVYLGRANGSELRLPQMGWNDVKAAEGNELFAGLEEEARFYFLHSYYFSCESSEHVTATTEYGLEFPCAVQRGNVYGVQFHPEKSHHYGARLLRNFAEL